MFCLRLDKISTLIYWTPKSGCSSIKTLYQAYENIEGYIHNGKYNKDVSTDIPDEILRDYTIIWVIRNPYERFVSGYVNKYLLGGELYNSLSITTVPNFESFVNTFKDNSKII